MMLTIVATDIPFVGFLSALIMVLVLVVLKSVYFKRFCYIEYIGLVVISIFFVAFKHLFANILVRDITVFVLSLSLLGYAIFDLFEKEGRKKIFTEKANRFLKNAPFDYYYATDSTDHIVDFSHSFRDLVKLNSPDLYNTLGFQTLISEVYITKINHEEINNANILRLNCDYMSTENSNKSAYFELTIKNGNEEYELLGVVEPIFYRNKFIGRNIYISKDDKNTLVYLQKGLEESLETIKDDRAQLYMMMSMLDNVIMYYDYNTQTYIMTEVMAKALNVAQRELHIEEFVALINPLDLQHYQEQGTVISSSEVTRISFRIKLGNVYHSVFEDSIYLNRNSKLISVIRLANYQEEYKQNSQYNKEKLEALENTEPIKKVVDYKEKLEDTVKVLEKLLGE